MPELDGKLLRLKHQESDFNVLTEINRDMMLSKEMKEKRKRKADTKLKNCTVAGTKTEIVIQWKKQNCL